GANRLASNSLLEGLVFGARAGDAMKKDAPATKHKAATLPGAPAPKPPATQSASHAATPAKAAAPSNDKAAAALAQIRDVMWRHVGIMRDGKELSAAIAFLGNMQLAGAVPKASSETAAAVSNAQGAGAAGHQSSVSAAMSRMEPATRADHELHNLHCLASLITRSALAREESRGSHYRADFPYRDDDKFQKHSIIQRSEEVKFES
ncbi:MAG TPA: hypothetical protein VLC94_06615, partial [Candidatus Acidoferrum sp.]|nr:hypothetical protein [Candidatus Acidoferrum sp.]